MTPGFREMLPAQLKASQQNPMPSQWSTTGGHRNWWLASPTLLVEKGEGPFSCTQVKGEEHGSVL